MTTSTPVARPVVFTRKYVPIETVESLERYRVGGYHPVHLGDRLKKGRYTVIHKLGAGGNGTIWLARDMEEDRYVAVKIALASDPVNSTDGITTEIDLRERLRHAQDNHTGGQYIHYILDTFVLRGPNGSHQCIVSPPGACSLASSRSLSAYVWIFPLDVVRAIAAQLIYGVAFLHSHGIAHGDIHPGNILLAWRNDIDSLTTEQLYSTYPPPAKEPIERIDESNEPLPASLPEYAVPSGWFGKASEDLKLADSRIYITDFGESWSPAHRDRFSLHNPEPYYPPEAMFAKRESRPLGLASDMWTLGTVLCWLYSWTDLFEFGYGMTRDDVIADQVEALGDLPQPWWDMWHARGHFFELNGSGRWQRKPSPYDNIPGIPPTVRDFEGRIRVRMRGTARGMSITNEEIEDVVELLGSVVKWKPDERATAVDLIQGSWMRKWGIPAVEQMHAQRLSLREDED